MTKLIYGLLFASLLAACGGGGSSNGGPIPNPGPSNAPTTYTASIRFVGPMSQQAIQADLRQVQSVSPMAQSTPIPVMIVSPADSRGCFGYECVGTSSQGVAQAMLSPMPSTQPSVSFTQTDPHAYITPTPTPAAGASSSPLPSGVVAENIVGSDGVSNSQSSGVVTATIGNPENVKSTTNIYQYVGIGIDCIPAGAFGVASSSSGPGWHWNGSAWVQVTDPTTADIYVTGSKCSGSYAVANDSGALNVPGGCAQVSTDTLFSTLAASQWSSAWTSMAVSTLIVPNADGSFNSQLICKTRDGHVFKTFPNAVGGSAGDEDYDGAIEVSGSSIDGF